MSLEVDWHGMSALRTLQISSGVYAFDCQLLQIVSCNALKQSFFDQVRPDSADSAKFFAALMHMLTVKRPDIDCYMDQVPMSHML